jgi:Ferritin-like domain
MTDTSTGVTRAGLLRHGACAAGVVAVGVPALVAAAQSPEQDQRVLELLLLVEYTESAFYAEAVQSGALTGELRDYAQRVSEHERQHLSLLKGALGDKARDEPQHDFGEATQNSDAFIDASAQLEDLAVAAYNGQAGNVSPEVFVSAARIVSVEARHAAWIRSIANRDPAPEATDTPKSEEQVRAGLRRLGVQL